MTSIFRLLQQTPICLWYVVGKATRSQSISLINSIIMYPRNKSMNISWAVRRRSRDGCRAFQFDDNISRLWLHPTIDYPHSTDLVCMQTEPSSTLHFYQNKKRSHDSGCLHNVIALLVYFCTLFVWCVHSYDANSMPSSRFPYES